MTARVMGGVRALRPRRPRAPATGGAASHEPANGATEPEAPPIPVINLMDALVASLTPEPAAAKPPARHVTKEAMRAETALRSLAQRAEVSIGLCRNSWAAKRYALVRSFPADVAAVLLAGGVLSEEDDLEAVDDGVGDGPSDG